MILPDHEIRKLAAGGMVRPYRPEQVQPSSYDVRLDRFVQLARPDWHEVIDLGGPSPDWMYAADLLPPRLQNPGSVHLQGLVLRTGEFCLGSTQEWVNIPDDLCCRVDGKSSLARKGLQIHSAGFVDPGYQGNITLEIINFGPRPVRLRYDCMIAQLEFVRLTSPAEKPYNGRYQGSKGAVTSRYLSDLVQRPEVLP